MHDTGPALAGVAADVRAGQAQGLPDELDKQRPPFSFPRDLFTVNGQGNFRHGLLSLYFLPRPAPTGAKLKKNPTHLPPVKKDTWKKIFHASAIETPPSVA